MICLLLSTNMFASHLTGGEIRYAYNGTNYTVTLSLYRDCQGIASPATVSMSFISSSCSYNFYRTFSLTSVDSNTNMWCPSLGVVCNSSSSYPMRQIYIYSDTVSLPPCSDWKISNSQSSLNASITNLINPGIEPLYLEAFLNNSSAINSNPVIADPPPFIIATSSFFTTSVQAVDPDNDSFVYEMIEPESAASTSIPYTTGSSVTSPMGSGSSASIDQANQYLQLYSGSMGINMLAIRVKEYRNGTLVGYSTRSWNAIATSLTAPKVPLPAPGTTFTYLTHPGQTQTISLTFNDSTSSDSVFVSFDPTNSWTYSTSSTPGAGSGSGSITWTTPSTLNPATTPYFYIYVPVHDNSCPLVGNTVYTILVQTAQPSPTDSVWPGDANDDYTVNMYDPLAIAVAYGQTGSTRTSASTSWVAQYCSPWANYFAVTNINMKHADCNGDGTVNSTDLAAVTANYGMSHPKLHGSAHKTTGVPDLYFDLSGITLTPGANVSVPIKFGTTSLPMNNIYGLAASVEIISPVNLAAAPTITYSTSWIGTTANTLNFTKNINNNHIDWAYARIDQTNVSGNSTIATLNFTVPATATAGQQMKFHFDMPRVIDKNGNIITAYNALDDSMDITVLGIVNVTSPVQYAEVVPNPSHSHTELQMYVEKASNMQVKIIDILGKTVWQQTMSANTGNQSISLPSANLAPGIYMIRVQGEGWQYGKTLKWIKE